MWPRPAKMTMDASDVVMTASNAALPLLGVGAAAVAGAAGAALVLVGGGTADGSLDAPAPVVSPQNAAGSGTTLRETSFQGCDVVSFCGGDLPEGSPFGPHGATLRSYSKAPWAYSWFLTKKGGALDWIALMHAFKQNKGGGEALIEGCAQAALATFGARRVALIALGSSGELVPSPDSAPSRLAAGIADAAARAGRVWSVVDGSTFARNRVVGKASGLDDADKRALLKGIYDVSAENLDKIRALGGVDLAIHIDDDFFSLIHATVAREAFKAAQTAAGIEIPTVFVSLACVLSRHVKLEVGSTMDQLDEPTRGIVTTAAQRVLAKPCDDPAGTHMTVLYYFRIGDRADVGSHIGSKKLVNAAFRERYQVARARGDAATLRELALQLAKERVSQHAWKADSAKGHNQKARSPPRPPPPPPRATSERAAPSQVMPALEREREVDPSFKIDAEGNYGALYVLESEACQCREAFEQTGLCAEQLLLTAHFRGELGDRLPAEVDAGADPLNVETQALDSNFGGKGVDTDGQEKLRCHFARVPRPRTLAARAARSIERRPRRSSPGNGR